MNHILCLTCDTIFTVPQNIDFTELWSVHLRDHMLEHHLTVMGTPEQDDVIFKDLDCPWTWALLQRGVLVA